MNIGLRYLGFLVPLSITSTMGARMSSPLPGFCAECGKKRARVYYRWDQSAYCEQCIEFDIAAAQPHPDQSTHPPTHPIETVYERAMHVVTDGADLRVYERALT